MQYYRVCLSLSDKGVLVPEGSDFNKYTSGEAYVSAFKYTEDHYNHFLKHGSVAGITNVKTDDIYFDIDCGKDVEKARQDTIKLVETLKSKGINPSDIKISISGNKGFHVSIKADKEYTPDQIKSMATKVAANIDSFDSVIYNPNRIIRMEGSIHPKTGLRKTVLTFDELKTLKMAEIKRLASEAYQYVPPKKIKLPEPILKLMEEEKERHKLEVDSVDRYRVDYFSNPMHLSPMMLAASQGFFPNGQRSNTLIILAANLMAKGVLKEQCYSLLKVAADLQSKMYGSERFSKQEIWSNIIEQVYGDNWKGGTYLEENYPRALVEFYEELGVPKKFNAEVSKDVVSLTDRFDDFIKYGADIEENTVRTGIPSLDAKLRIRKGHLIGLLAGPGVGKTSLAVTILNNTSKEKQNALFFSYDMYSNNIYQKLIQRHTGLTEDELYEYLKNKDFNKIEEFRQLLVENYENVSFCFNTGQSISDLKKTIKYKEDHLGKKLELVVVDYLELVQSDKSDATASSLEVANGLREVATEGRVVIVLLQPNKISSKPDQPLLSYNAAKGSAMVPQAVTAMITCHRPGYSSQNPENDEFFSINVVKNRNGSLFQLDFGWNGGTQTIYELDQEGKYRLDILRDTKKDAENDKDGY